MQSMHWPEALALIVDDLDREITRCTGWLLPVPRATGIGRFSTLLGVLARWLFGALARFGFLVSNGMLLGDWPPKISLMHA